MTVVASGARIGMDQTECDSSRCLGQGDSAILFACQFFGRHFRITNLSFVDCAVRAKNIPTPVGPMSNATTTEREHAEEYSQALAFAREALTHIGTFKTPPTPPVYEVWYRYVDGTNEQVKEQLSHAVNVAKSVNRLQLEQMREQFLDSSDLAKTSQEISESLSGEIESLQTLITGQLSANSDFDDSLNKSSQGLKSDSVSPAEIREFVENAINSNAKMRKEIAAMACQLHESQMSVKQLNDDLVNSQKSLHVDPLTGIGNRRYFDAAIDRVFKNERCKDALVYLMLIDLDKFKEYNDLDGHALGDEVLKYAASEIQRHTPHSSIARFGGDEFAVVLHTDSSDEAMELGQTLCAEFANNDFLFDMGTSSQGSITISLGASLLRPADTKESWFERADKLLYSAKDVGGNRAMVERRIRE